MLTRNIRLTLSLIWWSSRAGLPAQLLSVTQQAGGPRGRKLPGFTVASDAPPPLLAVPHLSSVFVQLLEKPKHTRVVKMGAQYVLLDSWLFSDAGGVRPCIRPRPLCRRGLQFTAELRCTSRVMRIKSTGWNIVDFLLGLTVALLVSAWERHRRNVFITKPTQ